MPKALFLCLSFLLSTKLFASQLEIYDLNKKASVSLEQVVQGLAKQASTHIVLGEFHYTRSIHLTQAMIIKKVVQARNASSNFTVGWEFLNHKDQQELDSSFKLLKEDSTLPIDFMSALFKNSSDQTENLKYFPIFAETAELDGDFLALNAPRSVKRHITKGGLSNLPPEHRVPNMSLGGASYLKRFKAAMGGHVSGDTLTKYYEAQCYTDSVMAYYFTQRSQTDLNFTIVGSFHSDYLDGYIEQLKRYSALEGIDNSVVGFKIIDESQISEDELSSLVSSRSDYGKVADFLVIIKNPNSD